MQPQKIGIFGVGVVGTGVIELIRRYKPEFIVSKAFVRNPAKPRGGILDGIQIVHCIDEIIKDPEITYIIEVLGGTTTAWDIVRSAIKNGKHVVTANKSLISKFMADIEDLLQANPNVHFSYDAAVCGGIPIIPTLGRFREIDSITSICGIMNGTTNYILSAMTRSSKTFKQALMEAQTAGLAEADPSSDILGYDSRSKLCILAKYIFDITVEESLVPCQGISSIEPVDIMFGKKLGREIKLLSCLELLPKHDMSSSRQLSGSVWPVLIPMTSVFQKVQEETNAVNLVSENLGANSFLIGPGAGRYPTATSILGDLESICSRNENNEKNTGSLGRKAQRSSQIEFIADFESKFYFRFQMNSTIRFLKLFEDKFKSHAIGIELILEDVPPGLAHKNVAIITAICAHRKAKSLLEEITSSLSDDARNSVISAIYLRYT